MDDLAIPAFLDRKSEESAWLDWPVTLTVQERAAARQDNGPGSVARRLGYPEHPGDATAREEIDNKQAAREYLKRQADEPRFEAMREAERQEKEDERRLKAEAASRQRDFVVKYGKTRRRVRSV